MSELAVAVTGATGIVTTVIGDVIELVTAQPILMLGIAVMVIGIGIGLFKSLKA